MDEQQMWQPDSAWASSSALADFAKSVGRSAADYPALHAWSVSDLGGFWSAFWDFAGVIGDKGDIAFTAPGGARMTGAQFFPEARLNIAENFLKGDDAALAVIETDEDGGRRDITRAELRAEVARIARGMRTVGVGVGDSVGVVLPNRLECLVTQLAAMSIGAIWTSCSPDFGVAAILDRIGRVNPKLMIVQAQVRYGGKDVDLSTRLSDVARGMVGLEHLVTIGAGDVTAEVPVTDWQAFGTAGSLEFERLAFDAPCYVLYTSGTTGAPKAIVHRTGGVLLQQLKEHMLHGDLRQGDRFLWYTNTAWMMYHWVVASLGCGATVVLYDGAPIIKRDGKLDCSPLWTAVADLRLTHLGISPKYLATLAEQGYAPGAEKDLSSLRWMLSAGSPVAPHQYDWIYDKVKADLGFASISGGTEIMGCFLLGSPLHPVTRGHLTVRGLGMAANVLDDRGAPIIGRAGDLVCTEPFPSMPLTFWGPDGDARYHKAYFAERAEIWTHGDHAQIEPDGTAVIHGRSDCTLNPGGVRIGTADIYNVCENFPQIEDSIVFGRAIPGDEEIVLCLILKDGQSLGDGLARDIRMALRAACSPRHVPACIYQVSAIPYTVNGKRVEAAARAVASGLEVKNRASLVNEECLLQFSGLSREAAL
ncbi:acetoacetate--CoA ligase [Pseudoruegeria sp. SK021]|uniref:acetoacetate--CoA ligase n=1 Tax=Pseudoruegeria sp. SK021 TaxID=1933035 RepID=UPI000A23C09F|nr:acetoacetate--CoA ligase [Pseudoruegeria sp. SK021]OSP54768.1 acetoacetate--CoA ligase [Pseudoruegeria sp. SK021]